MQWRNGTDADNSSDEQTFTTSMRLEVHDIPFNIDCFGSYCCFAGYFLEKSKKMSVIRKTNFCKEKQTWCVFQVSTDNRSPGGIEKIEIINGMSKFLAIPSASSCQNLRNMGYFGTGLYRINLGPWRRSEMVCDINMINPLKVAVPKHV